MEPTTCLCLYSFLSISNVGWVPMQLIWIHGLRTVQVEGQRKFIKEYIYLQIEMMYAFVLSICKEYFHAHVRPTSIQPLNLECLLARHSQEVINILNVGIVPTRIGLELLNMICWTRWGIYSLLLDSACINSDKYIPPKPLEYLTVLTTPCWSFDVLQDPYCSGE